MFVLPDRVLGEQPDDEKIIFQAEAGDPEHQPSVKGSLADWQTNVAGPCIGNNLLTFAASMGFAAPVLELLGQPSGGFHIVGETSKGKTTALEAAASVWGCRYVSWKTTDNEMENVAEHHNHILLTLDELSQVPPEQAAKIAYMLGNEQGKGRMGKDGISQRKRYWRLLFLSTGEITLSDVLANFGEVTKGGADVRMVNLAVDAGADMGIFENIHGTDNPANFSKQLVAQAKKFARQGRAGVGGMVDCERGQRRRRTSKTDGRVQKETHSPRSRW